MVRLIAKAHGKKIKLVKLFNPILSLMRNRVGIENKVFDNLVYGESLNDYEDRYQIRCLKETTVATKLER